MKHVHQAACFHSDSSVGLKEEADGPLSYSLLHPHGGKTKQKTSPSEPQTARRCKEQ